MSAPRVVVVYHFFAHYRWAVLVEMSRRLGRQRLVLGFGEPRPSRANIPKIPSPDLERIAGVWRLQNVWKWRALIQSGLLTKVLSCRRNDVLILLGDASYLSTWLACLAHRARGGKVYFWTHGTRRKLKGVRKLVLRIFYSLPNALLLYGARAQKLLLEGGVKTKSCVVFNSLISRNEINIERLASMTPVVGRILFCARLSPNKRLDLLIRAVAILRESGIDVSLDIVGDGPQRQDSEQLARDLGVDKWVYFYGEIYREDELERRFDAASVLAIPEAAGLSVIHALGYGVPVVTCDDPDGQAPECEAIQPKLTGGFFKRGDADDLARSLTAWLVRDEQVSRRCVEAVCDFYCAEAQVDAIIEGCQLE